MNIRKARNGRDILLIAGLVILMWGKYYSPLWIVGGLVICGGLVVHFRYHRCPHCGKQLGREEGTHCQHCGKALEK